MKRNTNIIVVNMSQSHIASIVKLEQFCFSLPWSDKAFESELKKTGSIFLVAIDPQQEPSNNDLIAGYIGMHVVLNEGYITNLAVFPNYRKKGIARYLIKTLLDKCRKNSLLFVSLEVRASNTVAIHLYKSEGFSVLGKRKNFYTAPQEDALIMTKYF